MLNIFSFKRKKYSFLENTVFSYLELNTKTKYARGLKILTTKQMLQRLPKALAKVKQVIHLKTY